MKRFIYITIASVILVTLALQQYVGSTKPVDATSAASHEMDTPTNKAEAINKDAHGSLVNESIEAPSEEPKAEINIDGAVYVNIMDEEKFASISNIAAKYDAVLYAIPYSDVFAIVKDETPIFFMSTGVASTKTEDVNILMDFFSREEFRDYTGLVEDFHTFIENGNEINVDLGNYMQYSIFEEDGWIYVFWS